MSKGKSTATAKRERGALRHDVASVPRYWTQWIKPGGAALLSETLGRCYFVMKNHGPASVKLLAAHGDLMDLPAGAVRATYAHGLIRVDNESAESVLIEFDFYLSK